MKTIVSILILFFTLTVAAQDPMLQNNDEQLELRADSITERYVSELALGSKQELLFKKKVEEFLIRAEEIKSRFEGKEKLDMLYALSIQETREMGDILTRPQLDLYKKLKPTLQPLAKVNNE
ncbi:MAG: hypothetical protein HKM28_00795 [Flavobacteriaceae bacterium]|nr:hypothetical protein [Flavobacteriaceae bacterium]